MNRSRALTGRAITRSSALLVALAGLGATAVACSAAPEGEQEARTSAAVSYSLYPPSNVAAFGAADLENAYNIPTYLQPNTTIAIITQDGDDPNAEEDLEIYRSAYGLPACTALNGCLTKVTKAGAVTGLPAPLIHADRMALALDMASAGCPNCKLLVVELNPTDAATALVPAITMAKGRGASAMIVTANWAGPAYGAVPTDAALAIPGTTIFASLDWTGFGTYPAMSPSVVSVGSTNLTIAGPYGLVAESASSTVGAMCTGFAKPSWQHDAACGGRTANDVSAVGGPVWTFNTFNPETGSAGWIVSDGTLAPNVSMSLVAAIFAQTGNGGAGPSYPYIHPLYFNDVVAGQDGACAGTMCNAAIGYDAPTGMGTPDGMDMALVNRNMLDNGESSINESDPFLGDQGTGTIVVSPHQTNLPFYGVGTDTTWAGGHPLSLSFTGLPQGVSVTNIAPDGSPADPGDTFQLVAATNATLGQQSTMTIAATAGGATHYLQYEIKVEACVPSSAACGYYGFQCGSISDGCGNMVSCGSCPGGDVCSSNVCCPTGTVWDGNNQECVTKIIKTPPPKCGGKLPACQ